MTEITLLSFVDADVAAEAFDSLPTKGSNVYDLIDLDVQNRVHRVSKTEPRYWVCNASRLPTDEIEIPVKERTPTIRTSPIFELYSDDAAQMFRRSSNARRSDQQDTCSNVYVRSWRRWNEGIIARTEDETWSTDSQSQIANDQKHEYSTSSMSLETDWRLPTEQISRFFWELDDVQRDRENLHTRLAISFEIDPVEDGMTHQAEWIIADALRSTQPHAVLKWIKEFSIDETRPVFAASVLRCIGRQESPGSVAWRVDVIRAGLNAHDIEVRDAAVRAAESWADPQVLEVLQSHAEPEQWLQGYISDVIEDLSD